MYKRKKIFLNEKKTKYCTVKLYKDKKEMQDAYKKERPQETLHYETIGVHCGYEIFNLKDDVWSLSDKTAIVFLSIQNCGASVIAHELMHAVLWAHKHKKNKKQYPIVIKNTNEEEDILHNLTYAVYQFYKWYWKVEKEFSL